MKRLGNGLLGRALVMVVSMAFLPAPASAANYRSALAHGVESRDRAEETDNPEDWADALDAFQEAGELEATKEAKFEFAGAASHLRFDDEACAAYAEALRLGLSGKAAELARSFIDGHQSLLARLDVIGLAGAVVRVGPRKRATLPLSEPLLVVAGTVHVQLESPDYQPWQADISLQAGETKTLQAELIPVRHELTNQPLAGPRQTHATVAAPSARASSTPKKAWGKPVLITGAALTALGTAALIVTTELISSERTTLKQNCVVLQGDECQDTTADKQGAAQNAADHIATAQNVRWVAVGATTLGLGAIATGLFRTISGENSSDSTHADLQISPNLLALQFERRF